jgi:predicted nuclease of restriction endonuclease-like (RecB) superfamily
MVKQVVSQLRQGHVLRLLQGEKDPETRTWYARQTIVQGWSRSILELQMDHKAAAICAGIQEDAHATCCAGS